MSRFERELKGLPEVYGRSLHRNESLCQLIEALAACPWCSQALAALWRWPSWLLRCTAFRLDSLLERTRRWASLQDRSSGRRQPCLSLLAVGTRRAVRARSARRSGCSPVCVICCRLPEQLPESLRNNLDREVHVAAPRDGFLATSSVVAMATALAIAYGYQLPHELSLVVSDPLDPVRARTIAVGGALQRAPLADLEARLSETGLSAVQAADLRNFAHGRHVGLERNAAETTVVFLSDATSLELTRRTADLLPDHIDVRHLVSTQQFPASVIELVAQSMALTAANGRAVEVDPANPGVAAYGRKLYRLTAGKSLTVPQADPIERKLAAASLNRSYRSVVERSLDHWLKELSNTRFKAIALDYDGTCCATNQR